MVIPTYIIHTFFVQLNLHALSTFYNLILYVSVGNIIVCYDWRKVSCYSYYKTTEIRLRNNSLEGLDMILIAWMIPTGLSLLSLLWQTSTETKDTVHTVALLFVFCWVLSAYRGFCDVFSLCFVSIEFVQISRILIFSNSAVNVVVYSLLKRDIRMELKWLLRCPAHQESLGFGLVHLQESIRANRPLDMGTDVSMPGHQEPGHTSNQSGLERVIWKYYDPKAMLFETVKNFFCIRIQSPACRCTSLGGWKGILNNDLYGDAPPRVSNLYSFIYNN